jgi:hypothetical protein
MAGMVVAASMVAHLGVLIASPMVAGDSWPADVWSTGRLVGFDVLLLPTLGGGHGEAAPGPPSAARPPRVLRPPD